MINSKLLIRNVSASLFFKAGAIVIGVLTIPAYLNYFDDQAVLGVWFTILAILTWMIFFDLGLGNGLKNRLIEAVANKKYGDAKELIIKSYIIIIAISCVLISSFFMLNYFFPEVVDISGTTDTEIIGLDISILILAVIILIQFPLRLVISVLLALQKSAIASLVPFSSQLLVLLFLLFSPEQPTSSKFIYLTAVYGVSICAPLIIATIYIISIISKWTSNKVNYSDLKGSFNLIVSGCKFFWIQLCLLAINGSNEFLIIKYNSPEDVVLYQVYFRVFSVFLIMFSTITVPLWSAVGQAVANNNSKRIHRIDMVMKYCLLIAFVGMVFLCSILQPLFDLWLGHGTVKAEISTSVLFSIYILVIMGINYSACIANGFNQLGAQLKFLSLAVVIKFFGLYFYSSNFVHWSYIVLLTIVSLLPALVFQVYHSYKLINSSTIMMNSTIENNT